MSSPSKKNAMDVGGDGAGSANESTHTSTLTVEIPIIPIGKIAPNESETAAIGTVAAAAANAANAAKSTPTLSSATDTTDFVNITTTTTPPPPPPLTSMAAMNVDDTKREKINNNNNNNNVNQQAAAAAGAGAGVGALTTASTASAAPKATTASTTITMTIGNKGKMDNDPALMNFKVLYALTQLCGLTMIILMASWIGVHMGGLDDSDNPKLEFNWHPLLMTIGLIFLYGNSILVYRGFRTVRKKTLKLAHAIIHMIVFILTVIALKTVFDSHNLLPNPIPNMYSLHSWLGLSAVILFCLQYVAGFAAYLAPGASESVRVALMPLHIYFGLFGFVLAIASALMGLTEKAIFSVPNYSNLPSSGVMVNMCGVFYVVFGGLVLYLATNLNYKRKPIPEDTILLTGANE